jgi:hypothetical protein
MIMALDKKNEIGYKESLRHSKEILATKNIVSCFPRLSSVFGKPVIFELGTSLE